MTETRSEFRARFTAEVVKSGFAVSVLLARPMALRQGLDRGS
jgi:hypothetical protein